MQDKITIWRERTLQWVAQKKADILQLRRKIERMSDNNYELGLRYLNQGLLRDAVFRFTIASWSNPGHVEAWYWLGAAQYGKGELRKAAFALGKAQGLRKKDPVIESMLAHAQGRAAADTPLIMPLLASHAAQISLIHKASMEHGWSEQEFANLLSSQHVFGYAVFVGVDMVGFILARHAADEGEILTLAVLPAHRRKGYARQLLESMLKEAERRKATKLYLEVAVSNAAAIALYSAAGFAVVGERKEYYTLADGSREDAVILRRGA